MSRAGKLLLRCGTSDCVLLADELLRKGRELIEAAQDEEVNLAHEVLEIDPLQTLWEIFLNLNAFLPLDLLSQPKTATVGRGCSNFERHF